MKIFMAFLCAMVIIQSYAKAMELEISSDCVLCSQQGSLQRKGVSIKQVPHDQDFFQYSECGIVAHSCFICKQYLESRSGDLIEIHHHDQCSYIHRVCFDEIARNFESFEIKAARAHASLCQLCLKKIKNECRESIAGVLKKHVCTKLVGCSVLSCCSAVALIVFICWLYTNK